jgi:hypothetical protein
VDLASPSRLSAADRRPPAARPSARLTGALAVLLLLGPVMTLAAGEAAARVLDQVVAEVDGLPVMASDVALGRALGLFGLTPGAGPLAPADVERYLDVRLAIREASALGIVVEPADVAAGWRALASRRGGEPALLAWLERTGVEVTWAREQVETDLRVSRFVDLRFRALAFVLESTVAELLGPGRHDETTRRQARAHLERLEAERRLAAWLRESRARIPVRRLVEGPVPDPLEPSP